MATDRQEPEQGVHPARAVEEQEEGHDEHGDQLEQALEQPDRDDLELARRVVERARELVGLGLDLVRDVVAVVVVAERLGVADVLDVGGHVAHERLDPVDDRRDEHEAETEHRADQRDVHQQDRQRARDAPPLDDCDQRGERDGDEGGDGHRLDDPAQPVQDEQGGHDGKDDQNRPENLARSHDGGRVRMLSDPTVATLSHS
jgi:hypothetical protein